MSDLPGYMRTCLNTGKLLSLAILVSGGIVLQILACALYNNWWPMLSGSNDSIFDESDNSSWVNFTKFLTGASTVGGIAIPSILKHAGVIGWGAFAMELSSYFVFGLTLICYLWMSDEDDYSIL
ncbi:vacuolar protein sorting-associated protein 55 homolog isoform X3 [Vigna radiata var. radiata]|uniref:Vacuolar protein sorting-associated protein 55 homolog isoform X3 n=1 Tax=Vigna radiata var. radiata TaxID=3916 RepID=A0A3Q0EJQ2_VIGRR|nr:vacuolar protein sorting-associated protein 55 homolog isoform X3 [Vigna radiata var. radiata]